MVVGRAEIGFEHAFKLCRQAPRISISVFTGKNGFGLNLVMLCRRMNRWVSNALYSGLFLMPRSESNGDMLLVAL